MRELLEWFKPGARVKRYMLLTLKEKNTIFAGRLSEYKYYDMDDVIKRAMDIYEEEKKLKKEL